MKLVSLQKLLKYTSFISLMENKNVGWLILGVAALIIGIIFLFNNAMKKIIDSGCSMVHNQVSCPAYETINQQTYLSIVIVGILVIVGIILIISKPNEKIIIKKAKETKKILDTSGLKQEEKQVLELIQDSRTIFQADLIEKTGFGKAKITRILDRLEGRDFIERKRRGMTNVVVVKE